MIARHSLISWGAPSPAPLPLSSVPDGGRRYFTPSSSYISAVCTCPLNTTLAGHT